MAHAAELCDPLDGQFHTHKAEQLRVTVLLNNVYALMPVNEIPELRRERVGLQAQAAGLDAVLGGKLVSRFLAGVPR